MRPRQPLKWGVNIGRLSVTWWDAWHKHVCLEFNWQRHGDDDWIWTVFG
jgi:hypothetical protein